MGNGVSTDQGNLQTCGKRDVRQAADTEQHDWSQLAEAPITNSLLSTANSYTIAAVCCTVLDLEIYEALNSCRDFDLAVT